jgi:cysteine-rich repeat protein
MRFTKFVGLCGLALASGPSLANFHLMKIVEVFPGTAASPNAQYIVLQMYTGGQNVLANHVATVFDATGTSIGTLTFTSNVANGLNQDKVLIATTQAATFFNLTADLTMGAILPLAGGKICFETVDCVAWGNYTGSPTGVGTPFNASTGLSSGQAAKRRLDIAGQPTILDASDDTDVSANDFATGLPAPANNARVNGSIPASVCLNGVIEGLESCDDGNNNNADACPNTCSFDRYFVDGFESP